MSLRCTGTGLRQEGAGSSRVMWVAIILIMAVLVGAAAGLLKWHGGAKPTSSILVGGAAFGATVLLLLGLIEFGDGGG